jgi:hypothetical protein
MLENTPDKAEAKQGNFREERGGANGRHSQTLLQTEPAARSYLSVPVDQTRAAPGGIDQGSASGDKHDGAVHRSRLGRRIPQLLLSNDKTDGPRGADPRASFRIGRSQEMVFRRFRACGTSSQSGKFRSWRSWS